MNNYISKNIVIFIGAGLVTLVLFAAAQYLTLDREVIRVETKSLRETNMTFQREIPQIIDKQFQIVEFFASTTYPKVALELFYDAPFYALLKQLNKEGTGFLLFNASGDLVSHRWVKADVIQALKSSTPRLPFGHVPFILQKHVIKMYPVYFDGEKSERVGYLGGVISTGKVKEAIIRSYQTIATSFSRFNPRMEIVFPHQTTPEPLDSQFRVAFKRDSPIFVIFNYSYGRLLLSGSVGILVLILSSLMLRSSMRKPIEELKRIVAFISKDTDGGYTGSMPSDPIFKSIGHSLIAMNRERIRNDKEKAQRMIHRQLAKTATQVAHDIRSPLSSMQAAIEYLGNLRIDDSRGVDILNLLELSAKRLTGIADDLLKRHKGNGEGKDVFSVHHLLDELAGEFQGQDQYKNVHFIKRYASHAIHIEGDAAKVQRAFGNIIKNAAEAMDFTGEIFLGTVVNGREVEIQIKDSGPGMGEEVLKRILVGGYTSGKADGHGIGMKVVHDIVKEHKGSVTAESKVGEGTAFFIRLPLFEKGKESPFRLEVVRDEPLLVVDDEASMREQWRLVLKDCGVKAILSSSFEEVVAQGLSSEVTRTAVVDYHFDNSEKTGADVIRHLQAQGFENLYLCTAEYWKPSVQRLAAALGVTLCPKPLPKIEVIEVKGRGEEGDKSGIRALVIDDDETIRMAWGFKKKALGIGDLKTFESMEACEAAELKYDTIDYAFVDKNITGSAWPINRTIARLKEKGVKKVVIASGESTETLRQDPTCFGADAFSKEKIPQSLRGLG